VRSDSETSIIPIGFWVLAGFEALLGWLLAVVLLLLGARPLAWVLGATAGLVLILTVAHAFGRHMLGKRPQALERCGLALVCIALEWPILGIVTLVILSYAGVAKWE
jgi:hypothetical protein